MWLVYGIATGGEIRLQFSTNVEDTTYTDLASSTDATPSFTVDSTQHNSRVLVPLTKLQNVPWYKMKISGKGQGKIYYMQRNVRVKNR
jgi:alkylated DNA repair dioxygenase AlkB